MREAGSPLPPAVLLGKGPAHVITSTRGTESMAVTKNATTGARRAFGWAKAIQECTHVRHAPVGDMPARCPASCAGIAPPSLLLEETNLHCGKAPLRDGWDVGGKEGCSLARGGWSLTKGAEVFSWILYSGMQVLLPCLFNIAAVVVHL